MGLDMYLTKKTYVKRWDHQAPEDTFAVTVLKGGSAAPDIQSDRIAYVEEAMGYWRKANAIHDWFVENVQDGRDECQTSYVSEEQLRRLLKTCREVLIDPKLGPSLLPTREGFFFGDTGYGANYLEDIRHTVRILEEALKDVGEGEFYYQASW